MIVWLVWLQGDDVTWLELAWNDDMTAEDPQRWRQEVERVRKLAYEEKYEMRIQRVEVPGVYEMFEIPSVTAS